MSNFNFFWNYGITTEFTKHKLKEQNTKFALLCYHPVRFHPFIF